MEENRKADHPDRRLKLLAGGDHQPRQSHHPPPQPLQNCPRCDSTNTKFCYYNNYSLSQPRYFCKTCRRYWTQGGTLRNVPVGGGCRKGKRAKTSSGSTNDNIVDSQQRLMSPLTLVPPPPPVPAVPGQVSSNSLASLGRKEMGGTNNMNLSPMNPYYPNGGFFPNSFAAMRSSPNLGHQYNFGHGQQFGIGGGGGSSSSCSTNNSNMALLQGFSTTSSQLSPLGAHQQQQQHDQVQIFNNNASDPTVEKLMMNTCMEPPYYLSAPNGPLLFGPSSWNQNHLANNNNNNAPASSSSGNAGMNPNHQWTGFGPPP